MERVVVHGLEQVTPILVHRAAKIEDCIAQWRLLQGDLDNYDIVFKDAHRKGEVSPLALVESLAGNEKKLIAYQREVNIIHNGIVEECDGAPTLPDILQNFASQNNLDASQYSLALQRRPLRYVLRKKVDVVVCLDGTTRTLHVDPDDAIAKALSEAELAFYDIHHETTHALIPPETTAITLWPNADDTRAIYLKPRKREVKITFQGEETIYAARGNVALRKIMNRWCTANNVAARFWTSEGVCAQESWKVADAESLKVEIISDKVIFTVTAYSDGTRTSSKVRGNSMDPIHGVLEKWCHLQDLSLDDCRFEWKKLVLSGIEVPAFLGMEDEEDLDVFPSDALVAQPTVTSVCVEKSGEVPSKSSTPPKRATTKRVARRVNAKAKRRRVAKKSTQAQSEGSSSSSADEASPGAQPSNAHSVLGKKQLNELKPTEGMPQKRPMTEKRHMTYEEWEAWDKREQKRMKRLRKQPREQDDINLAIALSLSEMQTQEA